MGRSGKQHAAGASSSINATINDIEQALCILVPKAGSPSERMRNTINILEEFFDWDRYHDSLDDEEDQEKVWQMRWG